METIINKGDVEEYSLQTLLESHPQFPFATKWQMLETRIILEAEEAQETGFFLETVDSQLSVVDPIKPDKKRALGSKNHQGVYSLSLVNTLSLLREYQDYLYDRNKRQEFHEKYGFSEFRPRLAGIIRRKHDLDSYESQMSIQDEYKNLRSLTYEDIVNRVKRRRVMTDQILSIPDEVNPARSQMDYEVVERHGI
jgi:hypothetical protein